jgi:hypothetical protein
MERLRDAIQSSSGYRVLTYTPYVMMLRSDAGIEVTLSKYGRMLIRNASTEEEARRVAMDLLSMASGRMKHEG